MGRKIPFENVVKNLENRRYTKSCGDYANTGAEIFDELKFSENLGVSKVFLRDIGLLKKGDNNGWNLILKPSKEELLSKRKIIEEEFERQKAIKKMFQQRKVNEKRQGESVVRKFNEYLKSGRRTY